MKPIKGTIRLGLLVATAGLINAFAAPKIDRMVKPTEQGFVALEQAVAYVPESGRLFQEDLNANGLYETVWDDNNGSLYLVRKAEEGVKLEKFATYRDLR